MISVYLLLFAGPVLSDLVNFRTLFGSRGATGASGGGSLLEQAPPTPPDGVVACHVRGKDLHVTRDRCTDQQVRFQTIPRQEFLACSEVLPFNTLVNKYQDMSEVSHERASRVTVFFSDCSQSQQLPALRVDDRTDFVVFIYFDGNVGSGLVRTPLAFFTVEEAKTRREKIRRALNELATANDSASRLAAFTKAAVDGGSSTAVKLGSVAVLAAV